MARVVRKSYKQALGMFFYLFFLAFFFSLFFVYSQEKEQKKVRIVFSFYANLVWSVFSLLIRSLVLERYESTALKYMVYIHNKKQSEYTILLEHDKNCKK